MSSSNSKLIMKSNVLIFLAVCVLCTKADFKFRLAKPDLFTRIVGGKDAEKGQFPYQVALYEKLHDKLFCGGSIISSRFLLTAAHCLNTVEYPEEIFAVAGTVYRNKKDFIGDGAIINIKEVIQHEDYDQAEKLHDIGLLRTEEIIFTNFIQSIALPKHNIEITNVVISGFGSTQKSPDLLINNNFKDILQYIESKTITIDECKSRHEELKNTVRESNICTFHAEGVGVCFGDSGRRKRKISAK